MSKYTTELRYICEMYAGGVSKGYDDVNTVIQAAIPKVFSFDFPIFDEAYRNVLCTKILKHYYTREIAAETVGLWKLWLDAKLNEIMPYYNQLYKTQLSLEKLDPLTDVNLTTMVEPAIQQMQEPARMKALQLEATAIAAGIYTLIPRRVVWTM